MSLSQAGLIQSEQVGDGDFPKENPYGLRKRRETAAPLPFFLFEDIVHISAAFHICSLVNSFISITFFKKNLYAGGLGDSLS